MRSANEEEGDEVMGMKLPADIEAKILATPGVKFYGQEQAVEVAEKPRKMKPKELVEPGIAWIGRALVLIVAVETKNEINQRAWQGRNRRAGAAWMAVRKAVGGNLATIGGFALHFANGNPLRVTFTRLGGLKLDQMVNLGAALKGCEDAIAYLLGADDGSPLWIANAKQEPGGLVGVRIEIELA